jgi:YjbE family integral membrane protein
MSFSQPEFWIALVQIIGVNIVLSGDNAVVIALAARGLPADQQKKAIAWGSGAAVIMRIALTIVAVELLRLPYLKLVGAGLLLWIAVQLLLPEDGDGEGHGGGNGSLAAAIKTILLADLVMSLDNVIAVAAAAKGNTTLLIIGLAISIPLVVFASTLLLKLMERFPVIITLGAALLGWVAGDMLVTDPVDRPWVDAHAAFLHWGAPLVCAILVVTLGKWLSARRLAQRAAAETVLSPTLQAGAQESSGHLRKVLLPVDGSDGAARAVHHLLRLREDLRHPETLAVHLVNVQRQLPGDVSRFVPGKTLEDYHRERSEEAFAPVREQLAAAAIVPIEHRRSGEPGPTIAQLAQAEGCDLIVMGTRGLGPNTAALIGSVAQNTVEHSSVPVMLVK